MEPERSKLLGHIQRALDKDESLELLRRSIRTASVTGREARFAELLGEELKGIGACNVTLENFAPGRPNVWGERTGKAGAPTLLLWGHTDTVHVRGWREHWAGTEREDPFAAAEVDGAIWGRGASDLKAGICTILSAIRTLDRAGVEIDANLLIAFVGDEESGEADSGMSEGARHLAGLIEEGRIERPDFSIYVEPTMLDVYVAHMGFLLCDIKVTGRSAYFGVPELGVDAIQAAAQVLSALAEHSRDLESKTEHSLIGRAFLLVTGIAGGGYIAVPGECTISLIRKVLPSETLDDARNDLERIAKSAVEHPKVSLGFTYTTTRDHPIGGTPFELPSQAPQVDDLVYCIKSVRPDRGHVEAAPYWSELPFLSRMGIPGAYFAPGDIRVCHTEQEHVIIEDYLDGITALAAFLASQKPA